MPPPPLPADRRWSTKKIVLVVLGALAALLTAIGLMIAGIFLLITLILKSCEPYDHAVDLATHDTRVIERLGEPVATGWMTSGNVSIRNSRGNANLNIPLHGPLGEGSVEVVATKAHGTWTYHQLEFHDHRDGQSFTLGTGP